VVPVYKLDYTFLSLVFSKKYDDPASELYKLLTQERKGQDKLGTLEEKICHLSSEEEDELIKIYGDFALPCDGSPRCIFC